MDPNLNARLKTLLRYTYRANMVFFAAGATWYVVKGFDRKEAAEMGRAGESGREEYGGIKETQRIVPNEGDASRGGK